MHAGPHTCHTWRACILGALNLRCSAHMSMLCHTLFMHGKQGAHTNVGQHTCHAWTACIRSALTWLPCLQRATRPSPWHMKSDTLVYLQVFAFNQPAVRSCFGLSPLPTSPPTGAGSPGSPTAGYPNPFAAMSPDQSVTRLAGGKGRAPNPFAHTYPGKDTCSQKEDKR